MRQVIQSSFAPEAIGPYSQAIETDQFIFTSGQIPINPKTGKIEGMTIEAQAEQVMQNIKAILAESGIGMDRILKTTVFLSDMNRSGRLRGIQRGVRQVLHGGSTGTFVLPGCGPAHGRKA